jgi:hypothetical protein
VLGHARPDPHQDPEVHDRREHLPVDRDLLDLVDGSNQLGAIVTGQAITACPVGARWAATGVAAVPTMTPTTSTVTATARGKSRIRHEVMGDPPR